MRFLHPSEPGLGYALRQPGASRFDGVCVCRCFGIGESQSTSSTSAATNAASDNADIVQGGAVTRAGDFSDVQSGGVRNEDEGTVIALTEGSKITTGVDVAGASISGGVNVTTADPQVLRDAFAAVAALN